MRRRRYMAALAGGATATAGCLGGGGDPDDYDVGMSVNAFKPETVTVSLGGTVVWRNTSGRRHTVTAYDEIPDGATYFATGGYGSETAAREAWDDDLAGGLDPGETYRNTFETVGTFPYVCIPHEREGMVGTVEVREE